ncbi:hypothetical protein [uncultured Fibrobacter sp.]|uniref:hypothetical protein n=1 Tax=uncultured Fibrobacter sp. TaxID=261512 RepID=UPI0026033A92|nr:hypothetical protein [uncultured Fibrobacter sp.]
MININKSKVLNYVEKALSEQTTFYYGCQTPKWIREKTDAKAGDTVTVYGIPKKEKTKPHPHKEEGYAIISRKRVYNGTLLQFDGNKWLRLDGGKDA